MKIIALTREGDAHHAFELRDAPMPQPKVHEVLIRVSHFGLNYADVMARKGLYNDRPALPCVLGYEVVGEVEARGAAVTHVQKGDRVLAFTMFGGYAEYACADSRAVIPLSPDTPPEEAVALATQYCTAWFAACKMVLLQKGDRVLVHAAAGGVGTALVQIARWKGCEVFGTASAPAKLEHMRKQGVDHAINYVQSPFDESIRNILGEKRLDVVFDPIGGKSFRKSMSLLGAGGRIVTYGASEWSASKGKLLDKLKLAFGFGFLHPIALLMRSRSVIGINMLRIGESRPEYLQHCMIEVYEAYQKGILKPVIDSLHSAQNIADAHERLESRHSIGKIVVKWDDTPARPAIL